MIWLSNSTLQKLRDQLKKRGQRPSVALPGGPTSLDATEVMLGHIQRHDALLGLGRIADLEIVAHLSRLGFIGSHAGRAGKGIVASRRQRYAGQDRNFGYL